MPLTVIKDITLFIRKQRPYYISSYFGYAVKAAGSRTAYQIEQNRFGAVIFIMRSSDKITPKTFKKTIAKPSRGKLDTLTSQHLVQNRYLLGCKLNAESIAKPPAKGGVCVCVGPADTVVEMGGKNGDSIFFLSRAQQMQKTDRIGAARQGNGNGTAL